MSDDNRYEAMKKRAEDAEAEVGRLREALNPRSGKCLDCGAALDSPTKIGYCDPCFWAWLKMVAAQKKAGE
jgi:hypothetical protein